MNRGARLALAALFAGLFLALPASAHQRSASHSRWTVDERGASVTLRASAGDVDRVVAALPPGPGVEEALARYLEEHLRLLSAERACAAKPGSFRPLAAPSGTASWEWRIECPGILSRPTIESRLFLDVLPYHLHFARLGTAGAAEVAVLTEARPSWRLPRTRQGAASRVGEFIRLGAEHVLTGYDHLAFLLTLIVAAVSLSSLARVVTGFTLGHSFTLVLATLGWVHPNVGLVEAAIGLSIVVVATENAWLAERRTGRFLPVALVGALVLLTAVEFSRGSPAWRALAAVSLSVACYLPLVGRSAEPSRLRSLVAAAFGLVHGLGFAQALSEHPLQAGHLLPPLFGFNLGVELGQLAVATAAWGLLSFARRRAPGAARWVLPAGSAIACAAGTFWAVTRLP